MTCQYCQTKPNTVTYVTGIICPACFKELDGDGRALYDGNVAGVGHQFLLLIPRICSCKKRVQIIIKPCGGEHLFEKLVREKTEVCLEDNARSQR